MAQILTVDDDESTRSLLSSWLSIAGHEVFEAGDARAALDVMSAIDVAVVFCDVHMPGRDGIWLANEVRESYPHIAVVLATGATLPPRVSLQPGIMAYLLKPFDETAAALALADALHWREESFRNESSGSDSNADIEHWLDSLDK